MVGPWAAHTGSTSCSWQRCVCTGRVGRRPHPTPAEGAVRARGVGGPGLGPGPGPGHIAVATYNLERTTHIGCCGHRASCAVPSVAPLHHGPAVLGGRVGSRAMMHMQPLRQRCSRRIRRSAAEVVLSTRLEAAGRCPQEHAYACPNTQPHGPKPTHPRPRPHAHAFTHPRTQNRLLLHRELRPQR